MKVVVSPRRKKSATTAWDKNEQVYVFDPIDSLRLDEVLTFDHCLQALIDHVTMVDEDGELVFVKKTRASLFPGC